MIQRYASCIFSALLAGWGLAGWAAEGGKDLSGLAADAELVETRTAVPRLKAAAAFEPTNNIVLLDLSEYAGFAGLIVANGGLDPSEDSYFFKKHGFKVKIMIREEEAWSDLNCGRVAASSTTADVLPLYGRQFQVVVPALISYSRGADGIVVKNEIKQINDLKGKTIAASQFNESDFFIRYLTQQSGLEVNLLGDFSTQRDAKKINLIFCADSFGAGDIFLRDLLAGRNRLDGCVTWDPKTTEVVEGSKDKAKALITNKNLLIIADVLLVNRGFAEKYPAMVKGLVDGLLYGNHQVRTDSKPHLDMIAKAFKWKKDETPRELAKVHLANLPENLAFFAGTVDSAGSYGYIYESSVLAYGPQLTRNSVGAEKFLALQHLQAMDKEGAYKEQKADLRPIRQRPDLQAEQPLLARDVRFLFQPNSSRLDMESKTNPQDLDRISKMLQVSPGSTVLLRGHTDTSNVEAFRKRGGPKLVQEMSLKAIQLSRERCDEVKRILAENYKVDPARVDTVGCGWTEPLGDDQQQNRRVEVQWFTVD